ncbi:MULTISPECIES: large ribosomal subunit protein uL3 [Deferrisoma]
MAKGLIGRKLGMTQIFMGGEELIPVTVVEAGPCTVVQKKTRETDGYDAIQVGFGEVKPHKVNRPMKGHFRKAGVEPRRILREFRVENPDEFEVGQVLKADLFKPGDLVDVTGFSKGRGFQGVIKRHGFGGGRASHGSMFHRAPGSIGAKEHPGKVWKGKKLAGRMGARRVTVQNLQVVEVDPERNLILLRGAVPGAKNGTVLLRPAVKAGNR